MYESHFGFSDKPFRLSPDPKFFFASKLHQRALSYLQYGLEQAEGFIVITGPIGTGKTTLAKNLLSQIDSNNIVAVQLVTTKLCPDELIGLIASEFRLPAEQRNKSSLLKSIEKYLIDLKRQGKRAVLLVDEAQNLPAESVEELRMLSNFQVDGKPLLQSFLLGQEELRDIIQQPNMEQFRQRIIASCHLSPLLVEETKEYIEHRLMQVNWSGKPCFSESAYDAIFKVTNGTPRKINLFMDRVLLFAFLEEVNDIDDKLINQVGDEMKMELTGSLAHENVVTEPSETGKAPVAVSHSAVQEVDLMNIAYIKESLEEVKEIIDESLKQKIKMSKYLDRLIKERLARFQAGDEESLKIDEVDNLN